MKILDWSTALASRGGAGRADCLPAGEEVLREREREEREGGRWRWCGVGAGSSC